MFAGNRDDITNTIPDKNTESQNQATALIQRLDEIKSMDKSNLNPAEKRIENGSSINKRKSGRH